MSSLQLVSAAVGQEISLLPGQRDSFTFLESQGILHSVVTRLGGDVSFIRLTQQNHSKEELVGASLMALASVKQPIPQNKICLQWRQHGCCRYGSRCLFHHSQPSMDLAHPPERVLFKQLPATSNNYATNPN